MLASSTDDVADLHHVEQRRDPRRDVLAEGRRRGDERVIARHQLDGDRRDIFGEVMVEVRRIGGEHLAYAGDFRGRVGDPADFAARDQRVDFAELGRRRDRGERRVLDRAAVMLDQNQDAHCTTPKAFSLPTSSSTEPTLSPACRLAGSATFSTSSRRPMSTPSSSGVFVAIGLLFAFMMLGNDA